MRLRKPSRKTVCLGLIVLAGVIVLLPPRWTDRLGAFTQVLAPAQHGAARLIELTAQSVRQTTRPSVPQETYHQALERTQTLERMLDSANERIRRLQEANRTLTQLREAGMGPDITLVPASVIAVDPASWRDTRILNRGATRAIQSESWVTTRTLLPESRGRLQPGMPVLAGEILVGRIEQVTPFGCRLVLLSDVTNDRIPVRVVSDRPPDQQTGGAQFHLRGIGDGYMELFGVHFRYVEDEKIRVGDTVMSGPGADRLPIPLTIGHIDTIEKNEKHPRLYTCRVRAALEYDELRRVYVVKTAPIGAEPRG